MTRKAALLVCSALVALTALLALSLAPSIARADDAPVAGVPGAVQPVGAPGVRMESEAVQITVYGHAAECRADFRLVNEGPPRTLRVAFPSAMPVGGQNAEEVYPDTLGGFHAWQDGRPLTIRLVEGRDGPLNSWFYEHDLSLPAGATTVTVSYLFRTDLQYQELNVPVPPAPPRWLQMDGLLSSVRYVLHTGANWEGAIGAAVVRVTFADTCERWGEDALAADPRATTPGWTKPDPRTFQWVFRDFEPVQDAKTGGSPYDIRLSFVTPTWEPLYSEDEEARYAADPDWYPVSMWENWWRPPFVTDTAASETPEDMSAYEFTPLARVNTPFEEWPTQAWSVKGDDGTAWFEARLRGPERVRELLVVPGLATEDYRAYSRPKSLLVIYSDGAMEVLRFADDPSLQRFPVDKVTDSVRFSFEDVRAGRTDPGVLTVGMAYVSPSPSPPWLTFPEALRAGGVR